MIRSWLSLMAVGCLFPYLPAGEVTVERDSATEWEIYTLQQGDTIVRVAPAAGANAFSVIYQGTEFFRVPKELGKLRGVSHGNPILYPTPNRVRGASFTFEGEKYDFPSNHGESFIHGLVHSEEFHVDSVVTEEDLVKLVCSLQFVPGLRRYELFPFRHVFRITISVSENAVRWSYEVDNCAGARRLPFGVAFHPYLIYLNSREETYLRVPATHLMESTEQLPSGDLLELDGHPLDARQPRSLGRFLADDVFFGMRPEQPARVEFRDVHRSISFRASAEFTHLVVWTPDRPYFGIENQTCSTDAHNLAAHGKGEVAHLQICPPGEEREGSIEYRFE